MWRGCRRGVGFRDEQLRESLVESLAPDCLLGKCDCCSDGMEVNEESEHERRWVSSRARLSNGVVGGVTGILVSRLAAFEVLPRHVPRSTLQVIRVTTLRII